jgi:mannosyltransferase OCH1-like enzyme
MIPKIIWQTYKDPFDSLPEYIVDVIQTWKDKNPDYEYKYMSDDDAKIFIYENFGQEWLDIFNSYPLGVMRGDLWRYMILYIYGGIYIDIDTICKIKIDDWVNKDKELIISLDEDGSNFAQLAFASIPKHPTLKIVLDLIKSRSKINPYPQNEYVDTVTGVKVWTDAIKLGIEKNHSIYCYDDPMFFHNKVLIHLVGSKNWKDGQYVRWQKEIKLLNNIDIDKSKGI